MTKLSSNQKGIAHLGLLMLVLVVAAAGAVAFRVHQASTTSTTSTAAATAKVPAKISSHSDVVKAAGALDATNVDSVNPNSLDSDLNSLL